MDTYQFAWELHMDPNNDTTNSKRGPMGRSDKIIVFAELTAVVL